MQSVSELARQRPDANEVLNVNQILSAMGCLARGQLEFNKWDEIDIPNAVDLSCDIFGHWEGDWPWASLAGELSADDEVNSYSRVRIAQTLAGLEWLEIPSSLQVLVDLGQAVSCYQDVDVARNTLKSVTKQAHSAGDGVIHAQFIKSFR